jgi:hypothetical protein
VLGVLGAVLVVASLYFGISYLSYLGKVVIEFLSANDIQTLTSCGVVVPPAFTEMRDQFPTAILPMLYLGIPLLLVIISMVMFGSGYYYGKHRMENEAEARKQREEHIQREVERRTGARPAPSEMEKKPPEKQAAKPPEKPSKQLPQRKE